MALLWLLCGANVVLAELLIRLDAEAIRTYDRRLAAAARAVGFSVVAPGKSARTEQWE